MTEAKQECQECKNDAVVTTFDDEGNPYVVCTFHDLCHCGVAMRFNRNTEHIECPEHGVKKKLTA